MREEEQYIQSKKEDMGRQRWGYNDLTVRPKPGIIVKESHKRK